MANSNIFSTALYKLFQKFLSVPETPGIDLANPKTFLIVRQHNQLGDLLAGVSLFRAIKEKYPQSHLTLIVSPFNYPGMIKNKFIDRVFVFDKSKIYNPFYIKKFRNILKENYDVVIVPVTVSISFTSNLISRLANAKIRIGPKSLDGKENESAFFFDRRIDIDWRKHPDSNVSERSLDIIRPFGIATTNFKSEITFDAQDINTAKLFISSFKKGEGNILIGLHVGAGKPQNRWSLLKYAILIERLREGYDAGLYLTGSNSDNEEINFVRKNVSFDLPVFLNKKIPEVAALISLSDLFISNDTGIMHVAGTTSVPQISIFGPTNPLNWAPIGKNKFYIRKSDLIDDIAVDDVFKMCVYLFPVANRKS
jgi:lipopolysaccharide heptosyltransferase II